MTGKRLYKLQINTRGRGVLSNLRVCYTSITDNHYKRRTIYIYLFPTLSFLYYCYFTDNAWVEPDSTRRFLLLSVVGWAFRPVSLCAVWCEGFCAYLVTVDTPSTNFVLNNTLALLNIPSFNDTTINCECLKWVFNIWPIFWVCERSKAASTSSKIYNGAGLNNNIARIRDKATKDLEWWQTENVRLLFLLANKLTERKINFDIS